MANKYLDTELFDKAVVFAVNAHKNVERKGHGTPYVLHVFEASSIVESMTNDIELLISALLHDTVEDASVTIDEIKKEFGERVANLVESETEKNVSGKTPTESWMERKQSIINKLKSSSLDAKKVALGDKLSNIRAIARDYENKGNELWSIFHNSNPKDIKWYYTSLKEVLSELNGYPAYKEFCFLVDKVFDKI